MPFNAAWLVLVGAAMLGCCIGFKKFIWFLSIGYGLGILCIGVAMFILALCAGVNLISALPFYLMCLVLVVYGARLGLFLLFREMKNASYKKTLDTVAKTDKKTPIFVSISMWIMNSFLFFAQASGLYYRAFNGKAVDCIKDPVMWVGLVISVIGVVLEAVADAQKSKEKKENPHMAATKGVFKLCRCPNYFGEMLVWTGVLVSAVNVLNTFGEWFVVLLGWVLICYIMINGAQRLEKRHVKNYGTNPEYVAYARKTPIIIPFIPLYNLNTVVYRDETIDK